MTFDFISCQKSKVLSSTVEGQKPTTRMAFPSPSEEPEGAMFLTFPSPSGEPEGGPGEPERGFFNQSPRQLRSHPCREGHSSASCIAGRDGSQEPHPSCSRA